MKKEKQQKEDKVTSEKIIINEPKTADSGINIEHQNKADDKVEKINDELNIAKDRYLRLLAEYDNYRRRTQIDFANLIQTANENIMVKLLPVLDDFERLFAQDLCSVDRETFIQGVELIYRKFVKILMDEGLDPLEAINKPFDSDLHEAISKMPSDQHSEGTIIAETERGYKLRKKVIRHSKVVVSCGEGE